MAPTVRSGTPQLIAADVGGVQASEKDLSNPSDLIELDPQVKSSRTSLPLPELSSGTNGRPSTPKIALSLRRERIYLAVLCWCALLTGWGAASLGPLLSTIQDHYHINYTILSMIFIAQCCGTIPAFTSSGYLTARFGFGKLIALGAALQLVTFGSLAAAPPFPMFCIIFSVNGLAGALQMVSCNIFLASLPRNGPTNLGVMHAAFGAGALASPLVATQFAQRRYWSLHYLTNLGFAIVNNIIVILVFRWKRQEELVTLSADRTVIGENQLTDTDSPKPKRSKLLQVIRLRTLHCMLLFTFVYMGAEITTGGWIVTFLQRYRGGGASTGYVSSGFFGGLMLGRVALLPLNKMIGPDRAVVIYTIISIGLELVVWLVPSLIGDAVAVSFVGMFIGPSYPILINVASRKLPKELLGESIGLIAAVGQMGGALFPFINGALASRFGVQSMQPLIFALLVVLVVIWIPIARAPLHSAA